MQNGRKPMFLSITNHHDSRGIMSILQEKHIPFSVQRSFWIRQVPENTRRGGHAHKTSEQLLICLNGRIDVELEALSGNIQHFKLEPQQNQCLYLPPLYWGYFTFRHNAMAFCMASDHFDESDYIRDYQEFEKLKYDHQY